MSRTQTAGGSRFSTPLLLLVSALATDEMVNGGFGFHPMWQNLLRYIDALDVDAIRAEVEAQGPWQ